MRLYFLFNVVEGEDELYLQERCLVGAFDLFKEGISACEAIGDRNSQEKCSFICCSIEREPSIEERSEIIILSENIRLGQQNNLIPSLTLHTSI